MNGLLITYLGFKEMLVFGGSSDNVYSVDADLNRLIWKRHFETTGQKADMKDASGLLFRRIDGSTRDAWQQHGGRAWLWISPPAARCNERSGRPCSRIDAFFTWRDRSGCPGFSYTRCFTADRTNTR